MAEQELTLKKAPIIQASSISTPREYERQRWLYAAKTEDV